MSCIEKMTIQGIRSYGPKEQDTQVIEFFFPVTLIIGQNGCGKTTIIECLKFATTGDFPPNTKGSSFVFDPKLIDEIETKGRIKLYFRDTSNTCVQVHKNLCSTQKAKKLEFRTAETIISRYSKDNKLLSSITSKCINADAEVVNAFGVSKAVLEHVIFCHQEDSNWPLSEGKLLKTRFDEIFSATKYIKALDILRKIRLEKNQLIKQKEVEKKFLEANKNHAFSLTNDLEDITKKYDIFVEKKEAILEQLKPIQKQIEKYFQQSSKIISIKGRLDKIENEKQLLEKQIKELLISTKHCHFQGTDDELKEHVETYSATTDKMRMEEEQCALKKIDVLNRNLKELGQQKSRLIVELGALENKQKVYNEHRQKLLKYIEKTCPEIEFGSFDCENFIENSPEENEQQLNNFMKRLKQFISDFKNETKSIEETNKENDKKLQMKLEEERDLKSKMDQNIVTKKELIVKNQKQLEIIEKDLQYISNDNILVNLNKEIKTCDDELEEKMIDITDIDRVKNVMKDSESKRSVLREKEKQIDLKLNKLHADSKVQTEIDLLKSDKSSKENQIKKIRIHISEDLNSFFETEENEDLCDEINKDHKLKDLYEKRLKQVQTDLNGLEIKNKEIEKRQCSNDLKRKMIYDDLRSKEALLRKHEEQLIQIEDCISSPDDIEKFDTILENLQEEHKSNMDEKGFLNGVDKTYKRFLSQLEDSKSNDKSRSSLQHNSDHTSCPVCMRDFKDQQEIDETVTELKNYSKKLPKKMLAIDEKIKQNEQKVQSMIKMKPTKEVYEKIKNNDLAELREQMDNLDKNVTPKIKKDLKENNEKIKKIEAIKSYSESIQNEIVIVDKYANEIRSLDQKINQQKSLLGSNNEDNSDSDSEESPLERAKSKKSSLQQEMHDINKRIESYQSEINKNYSNQDKINALKEKLNTLKTRRNDLQSKIQKKTQLTEKQEELNDEIDLTRTEIKDLKERVQILTDKITDLNLLKQDNLDTNKDEMDQRLRKFNELQNRNNSITDLITSNRNYEKNESHKLADINSELKSFDIDEAKINEEIATLRKKLEEIKLELARHELKQRELNDNLQLRNKRQEYEVKKKDFTVTKDELDCIDANFNLKNFTKEKEKAEERQEELNRELNDIKTKMNVLEGKMETINEELDSDNYKNAMEKWSICASDLRVLEISVIDIEKYYKALDKAVMSYHLMKMNEINKTIRALWRQVYRGNDIDYVEIRSEEDGAEEVSLKSRRTYNYRVVLIKGDTVLDMRGRCSAGQKVLASIIIRLALAEVFCLNSGILALDEPTTNLDRENIESLSSALVDIIKTRCKQRNFQLIIITHDEDFVEMLGRSEYMDSFYRVRKDDNGFSKISKRSSLDM